MAWDADAILDRRRLKRRLLLWRVFAILALVAIGILLLGRTGLLERPHVASIDIEGVIAENDWREATLHRIAEDEAARALIVRVNSPGGSTAGSEALFLALRRVAEHKPVVAVIGTVGASGGYIAALGADHIIARETSLTGSIGVLLQTAEVSTLLNRWGIHMEALKSDPLKGQPSPFEPLSEPAREAALALIEDAHRWFLRLVATRRDLSPAEARQIGDGRIFTGRMAMERRLVDALGGQEEARRWLAERHGVAENLPLVRHDEEPSFGADLVTTLAQKVFAVERLTLDGLVSIWHP